jgi:hypothetical protein
LYVIWKPQNEGILGPIWTVAPQGERERKKKTGKKREKREKIHIHKSRNEPFRTSDTQRVNVLVFDMTDVMNDQIMDGMLVAYTAKQESCPHCDST